MSHAVKVAVPATSANLGPGFDALGLALGWHDVVEAELAGDELEVRVTGVGAGEVPLGGDHLVVRAMRATFDSLGVAVGGLRLTCRNAIPHGRGLGSSAAAIVAGVLAARALAGADTDTGTDTDTDTDTGTGTDPGADTDAALALAARLEGHPDNVAPCLLGGLTIAWTSGGQARAARLAVHPDVRPIVCVPVESLSTETARGLLPASVPHPAAARNAGRAALLVEALSRRPELLLDATEDELHQQYRALAMPDTLALVKALRERGLAAVVSGAGPSVLVLTTPDQRVDDLRGWDVRLLPVDQHGAVVTRSDSTDGHDMVANGHHA